MGNRDIVLRQLLLKPDTTQLELSKILTISLGTINYFIKPLQNIGAVQIGKRNLKVIDKEKILLYWASLRNLSEDIIYETRVEMKPSEIEKTMPPSILFSAYSGYKLRHEDVPADYSEVYVYVKEEEKDIIKSRYLENIKRPNLFVLKADDHLYNISKNNIVSDEQLFVDLWNLPEWYAKEFILKLKEKIF